MGLIATLLPYRWLALALALLAAYGWAHHRGAAAANAKHNAAELAYTGHVLAEQQARRYAADAASTTYQAAAGRIESRHAAISQALRVSGNAPVVCPARLGDLVVPPDVLRLLELAGADPVGYDRSAAP